MSLSPDEVKKIAHLARIAIREQDIPEYADNLSRILSLVEQMNVEQTESVSPMAHPLDMVQRLRVDEPTEGDQRELFQQASPHVEAGLYLVPKVIE